MSLLTDFWKRIDGPVHPDDRPVLDEWTRRRGSVPLHLEFTPVPFWGAVDDAPVLVLQANGGYRECITEAEFAEPGAVDRHLAFLRSPGPIRVDTFTKHFKQKTIRRYLEEGRIAFANALGYRSPKVTAEVVALANRLPSVTVAHRWLREEVLPNARFGGRLVIFHRWKLWGLQSGEMHSEYIRYVENPKHQYLSSSMIDAIESHLGRRSF